MTRKLNFTKIYMTNGFKGRESVSGAGSDSENTVTISKVLVDFIKRNKIKTVLDAPCGDFNWMKNVVKETGILYHGVDIVNELIQSNNAKYSSENVKFSISDIVLSSIPGRYDLVICRDCLVHLSFESSIKAISNLKSHSDRYVAFTTFTKETRQNLDFEDGTNWYPMNLLKQPFNLSAPETILYEDCKEGSLMFTDKALGIWKSDEL